jgi:hypothetical protein
MLAASKVDSQALSDQCGAGQSSTAGSSTSARAERRRPSVHDIQGIAVEIAGDVAHGLVGEGLRGASARPMNGSRHTLVSCRRSRLHRSHSDQMTADRRRHQRVGLSQRKKSDFRAFACLARMITSAWARVLLRKNIQGRRKNWSAIFGAVATWWLHGRKRSEMADILPPTMG